MDLPPALVRLALTEVVFAVPVGVYVHRDARRRGKDRPLAWGVGVGLLALPGLFVYVFLRERSRDRSA
ncbi:hypothetical protein NGM10_06915 [Halorussus salilacus]|uniref:hypothetical protein n=1 Tax=Halorussus salilacus TaxID=2953750 RepID=UPI0020A1BC76|nr:hypothetical protein [Halorussus salilacus]USZ69459.1 hypothetical protein NGM10_06915 [Halorussus salilacus]